MYALGTVRAAANGNVETPHPRAAHNLFLILYFCPLDRQWAAAVWTLCGSGNVDLFVYVIGDWPLVVLAMSGAGLASGPFRIAFGFAAGEWGRLTPRGALGSLQLVAQFLVLFLQALDFFLQLLVPAECFVAVFVTPPDLFRQFPEAAKRVERIEKQIIL